jgi:formylglycine-generating enzyme required for sulfatase activity
MSPFVGLVLGVAALALAGFPQPAARAGSDTAPPTGTVVINSNRSATNTPNVTLALTWDDGAGGSGVSRMRFSNDGATWSAWEALAAARAYALPGGDGYKTVRVQYLDKANNRSAVYSDYIRLDTQPPTGTIVINEGAETVAGQPVTLGLTWSDGAGAGVTRMRFSDNGSTWTAWKTPKTKWAYTLPLPAGYHTVRVQYLDGADNYSAVAKDYIKLQTTQTVLLPGNIPLVMVWIPAGTFMMGRYAAEQDSYAFESPQHAVTLTAGYWMGKYELTQAQWKSLMAGINPSYFQGGTYGNTDNRPVEQVSWNAVQLFIEALNAHITSTGQGSATMRLPSEAEWEHACRAATADRFYWGPDPDYADIGTYAWYLDNSGGQTHNVGTAGTTGGPNAFGLCDMSGNVWEWCQDWYHSTYSGAPTDGSAWESPAGAERAGRGGGFDNRRGCRSASRTYAAPSSALNNIGFRLARP